MNARAYPHSSIEGKVVSIAPIASKQKEWLQGGTVLVTTLLDNDPPVFKPEMSSNARIYRIVQETRYLTVTQVQKFLGLKRSRIYYLTSTGRIPFICLGKTLLFDTQDLQKWIESMKVRNEG